MLRRWLPSFRADLPRFNLALLAGLFCIGLTVVHARAGSAAAEARPCKGQDLFDRLRLERPEALASIEKQAEAMPFARGRFYKVTREGVRPSYLFGTLHLADPRITHMTHETTEALKSSNTLVVEVRDTAQDAEQKPSPQLRARARLAIKNLTFAEPSHWPERLLSREDLQKLQAEAAARHVSIEAIGRLKPAFLALWLDTPACAAGTKTMPVLDTLLIERAKVDQVKIAGLESIAEQVEALDRLNADDDRALLRSTIMQMRHADDLVETSIRRYEKGDLGELVAWMRSPDIVLGDEAARTPRAFLDLLLDARNEAMLAKIASYLKEGGAFIAVGAAHLPGEKGLASLIEKQGFTLERIE